MQIVDANPQTRWPDCLRPSPQVRLTLRTNGEQRTGVLPPNSSAVQAGFDAPTVAPTVADANSGTYGTSDYVAYRYVYASSRYPFVDNAVTGGGQLWPRSSPSPTSATHVAGGASKKYVVTVTKTTRSDVDKIWIYRTAIFTTAAEATNASAAGDLFYIGSVGNDGIAGTTAFTDDKLTDTSELLELDNYVAPTMQFCEFDGTYWWGIGNFSLDAEVTINGTSVVMLTDTEITKWFDGRNGFVCTFDGITDGGFDGRGSFYFKYTGPTSAAMYSDAALTNTVAVRASGTTNIHIRGPAATLYRSKPRNPFSWGVTDNIFSDDGTSVERVPRLFAEGFGSGFASAISLVGDDSYLIIHLEEPTRCFRLTLSEADTANFRATQKEIDKQSSVGSNFSQFQARGPNGQTVLTGIDTKNFAIMACDGEQQIPLSGPIFRTMRGIQEDNKSSRFFHGVYDARIETNCWWINTLDLGGNLIDTMVYQHAPTGQWGVTPAFQVSASATIYDPETKDTFTLIGTETGVIAEAFVA